MCLLQAGRELGPVLGTCLEDREAELWVAAASAGSCPPCPQAPCGLDPPIPAGLRGTCGKPAAGWSTGGRPRTSSRAWMANEVSQTCEPLVPCTQRTGREGRGCGSCPPALPPPRRARRRLGAPRSSHKEVGAQPRPAPGAGPCAPLKVHGDPRGAGPAALTCIFMPSRPNLCAEGAGQWAESRGRGSAAGSQWAGHGEEAAPSKTRSPLRACHHGLPAVRPSCPGHPQASQSAALPGGVSAPTTLPALPPPPGLLSRDRRPGRLCGAPGHLPGDRACPAPQRCSPEVVGDPGDMVLERAGGRPVHVPAHEHVDGLGDLQGRPSASWTAAPRPPPPAPPPRPRGEVPQGGRRGRAEPRVGTPGRGADRADADALGEGVVGHDVLVQLLHSPLPQAGTVVALVQVEDHCGDEGASDVGRMGRSSCPLPRDGTTGPPKALSSESPRLEPQACSTGRRAGPLDTSDHGRPSVPSGSTHRRARAAASWVVCTPRQGPRWSSGPASRCCRSPARTAPGGPTPEPTRLGAPRPVPHMGPPTPGPDPRGPADLAQALHQRVLLGAEPCGVAVAHGQVHLPAVAPERGGVCGRPGGKQPGGQGVCQREGQWGVDTH